MVVPDWLFRELCDEQTLLVTSRADRRTCDKDAKCGERVYREGG